MRTNVKECETRSSFINKPVSRNLWQYEIICLVRMLNGYERTMDQGWAILSIETEPESWSKSPSMLTTFPPFPRRKKETIFCKTRSNQTLLEKKKWSKLKGKDCWNRLNFFGLEKKEGLLFLLKLSFVLNFKEVWKMLNFLFNTYSSILLLIKNQKNRIYIRASWKKKHLAILACSPPVWMGGLRIA